MVTCGNAIALVCVATFKCPLVCVVQGQANKGRYTVRVLLQFNWNTANRTSAWPALCPTQIFGHSSALSAYTDAADLAAFFQKDMYENPRAHGWPSFRTRQYNVSCLSLRHNVSL